MKSDDTQGYLMEVINKLDTALEQKADILTVNLLKLSLHSRIAISVKGTIAEGSEKILLERFVPLNDTYSTVAATVLAAAISNGQWGDLADDFIQRDLGL